MKLRQRSGSIAVMKKNLIKRLSIGILAVLPLVGNVVAAPLAGAVGSVVSTGSTDGKTDGTVVSRRAARSSTDGGDKFGSMAYLYLEYMEDNLSDRRAFTAQEKKTADWIVEELHKIGYKDNDIQVQSFETPENYLDEVKETIATEGLSKNKHSQNIIVTKKGQSERTIIVGAHYDSVLTGGISDNASGVVLVLESAQRMFNQDSFYTIQFQFYGAEEFGYFGSKYYVENMTQKEKDDLVVMVNADVLFDSEVMSFGAGYNNTETNRTGQNEISQAIINQAKTLDNNLVFDPEGIYVTTDQVPFAEAGFTVAVLYSINGLVFSPADYEQIMEFNASFDDNNPDIEGQAKKALENLGPDTFSNPNVKRFVRGYLQQLVDEGFNEDMASPGFLGDVLHTQNDTLAYLNNTYPGRVQTALATYSKFLNGIVTSNYDSTNPQPILGDTGAKVVAKDPEIGFKLPIMDIAVIGAFVLYFGAVKTRRLAKANS